MPTDKTFIGGIINTDEMGKGYKVFRDLGCIHIDISDVDDDKVLPALPARHLPAPVESTKKTPTPKKKNKFGGIKMAALGLAKAAFPEPVTREYLRSEFKRLGLRPNSVDGSVSSLIRAKSLKRVKGVPGQVTYIPTKEEAKQHKEASQ